MGEGGERRRVGVVVGGHVHRLQRRDRLAPDGGDPLLQLAHLVGQGGLVAHRGGHAPQQRGDLRAGLDEPEDVVDEQQHVLVLDVAEVLGHRHPGQGHPQPHPRRLVHLAEHQGGLVQHAGLAVAHGRLAHLQEQVGALPGTLAHPGEHRHPAVVGGHPGDHLGDEHGLAHPGPAEQADLAALLVGGEQVDHLHPGLEHLGRRLQGVEGGGGPVDLPALAGVVAGLVEALPHHVPDVAQGVVAHRDADAVAGVAHLDAADQPVGRLHGDGPDPVVADLLGHLGRHGHVLSVHGDGEGQLGVDLGQVPGREGHVHDRAGDADDPAGLQAVSGGAGGACSLGCGHGFLRCDFPGAGADSVDSSRNRSRFTGPGRRRSGRLRTCSDRSGRAGRRRHRPRPGPRRRRRSP